MKTVAVLGLTLGLLALGMFVSVAPYQSELSNGSPGLLRIIELIVIVVLVHGWFNTLGLAIGAAYVGSVGFQLTEGQEGSPHVRAAVVRGFLVWGMLILGKVYFESSWSLTMAQAEYAKLAITALLLAFVVGYNPSIFVRLVEQAERIATGGLPGAGKDGEPEGAEVPKPAPDPGR